jgi:hypothetical protein
MAWHDLGQYNKPVVDRAWRKVLREWLCWDQSRIESWMRLWDPELRDEGNPFFYHDPVMRFVVGLFIADDVANALQLKRSVTAPHELMALTRELESVFEERPSHTSVWSDEFDWPLARRTVDALLAQRGTATPSPALVTEFERRIRELPLTSRCSGPGGDASSNR